MTNTTESGDHNQPASSSTQTSSPSSQKSAKPQPLPGDLTSRLVHIVLWFAFGTTVGLVAQMAVTRRSANLGAGMGIGLAAALTCAYKDSESLRVSPLLLSNTRKFCNRFENRLDNHSEQMADNSAGQERLEAKIDRLSERVNSLTLTMARLPTPDLTGQGQLLGRGDMPAKEPTPVDNHLNGNGRASNGLGSGFS